MHRKIIIHYFSSKLWVAVVGSSCCWCCRYRFFFLVHSCDIINRALGHMTTFYSNGKKIIYPLFLVNFFLRYFFCRLALFVKKSHMCWQYHIHYLWSCRGRLVFFFLTSIWGSFQCKKNQTFLHTFCRTFLFLYHMVSIKRSVSFCKSSVLTAHAWVLGN